MKRAERVELARRLLDNGRLSRSDIARYVGRSERWVRDLARQYPRRIEAIAIRMADFAVAPRDEALDEPSKPEPLTPRVWHIIGVAIAALAVFGSWCRAYREAQRLAASAARDVFLRPPFNSH